MPFLPSLPSPARIAWIAALALGLAGCSADEGDGRVRVLVRVGNLEPSVQELRVTARLDGRPATHPGTITAHLESFVIYLPPGTRGTLEVEVEAVLGDASCRLVRARASRALPGSSDELLALDAPLQQESDDQCALEISLEGDGLVSAEGLTCQGSVCRGHYARNTQVTLQAQPGPRATDVSWQDICTGNKSDCGLVITGPLRGRAAFATLPCAQGFCEHNPRLGDRKLNRVWGSAPDDVWVVGEEGAVAHFDGRAWTPVELPAPAPATQQGPIAYYGVSGHDARHVFICAREGYLFGYDGTTWTQVLQAPGKGGKPLNLRDLSFRATFGSLVGDAGQLFHYTPESGWQGQQTTDGSVFYGVWSGNSGVWMVGTDGLIARSDHGSFTLDRDKLSAAGTLLNAVTGTSDSDLWAVGEQGSMLHFDGAEWKIHTMPGAPATLFDVWGSGPQDYWAVGNDGAVAHYRGGQWARVEVDHPQNLRSVWGFGPDDVWIVGEHGVVLHRGP